MSPEAILRAPAPAKQHVTALDGLRGYAVGAVILGHGTLLRGGFIGVDVFFVLSGFLITSILLSELDRTGRVDFGRFVRNRACRLLPALVLTVSASLLYAAVSGRLAESLPSLLATLAYATNWLDAYHLLHPSLLPHTWSLAVEAQFYLVWPPLLILLYRRFRTRRVAIAAVVVAALLSGAWRWQMLRMSHFASLDRSYRGLDTRAETLLIGASFAFLVMRGVRLRSPVLAVAALAFLLWVAATTLPGTPWLHEWGLTLVASAAGVLIVFAAEARVGAVPAILRFAPAVLLGRISYGLYLFHYPLMTALEGRVANGYLWSIVVAVALATLSYWLIEAPILAANRRARGRREPVASSWRPRPAA